MYKMIVIDMDGTLLNKDHIISKRTKATIKKAIAENKKVVIATGRAFAGTIPYVKELGLHKKGNYTISCGGSLCLDNETYEELYSIPIAYEDIMEILKISQAHDLHISTYTRNEIIVHQDHLFSAYDALINHVTYKIQDFSTLAKDAKYFKVNLVNEAPEIFHDIHGYFSTHHIDDTHLAKKPNYDKHLFEDLHFLPTAILQKYTLVHPFYYCIEVTRKECTKWYGVQQVAKAYGIHPKEIIAIGDSGNDVSMIKNAGLGVAMGNAFDYVKDVADIITKTNNEDGIADIIERYLL